MADSGQRLSEVELWELASGQQEASKRGHQGPAKSNTNFRTSRAIEEGKNCDRVRVLGVQDFPSQASFGLATILRGN